MAGAAPSAEKQLADFLGKYSPDVAKEFRAARKIMKKRLPGAIELVYDNWNWLVIGYSPNGRPLASVFSLVGAPRWVTLCFLLNGPRLKDTKKLLRGAGKRVRSVQLLGGAKDLEKPEVGALIDQALELAGFPYDPSAKGKLVIQSISPKQRPRRPAS
jgi:hypothetical protein